MDEKRSADHPPPAPDDTPARLTRNTRALATDLTPGEGREYPDVPGYEVLGVLGHGGMGVVYRAQQQRLKRVVALKMIRVGARAGPEERERFQTEAEAVARLQHPHIVQIFEVGEHDGLPWVALEFVEGGSLASVNACVSTCAARSGASRRRARFPAGLCRFSHAPTTQLRWASSRASGVLASSRVATTTSLTGCSGSGSWTGTTSCRWT